MFSLSFKLFSSVKLVPELFTSLLAIVFIAYGATFTLLYPFRLVWINTIFDTLFCMLINFFTLNYPFLNFQLLVFFMIFDQYIFLTLKVLSLSQLHDLINFNYGLIYLSFLH